VTKSTDQHKTVLSQTDHQGSYYSIALTGQNDCVHGKKKHNEEIKQSPSSALFI